MAKSKPHTPKKISPKGLKIALSGLVLLAAAWGGMTFYGNSSPAQAADMVVYKSPTCGCCTDWVTHMEDAGYSVEVRQTEDMDRVKAELGVPEQMESCHTAVIDGYLIEGHVPADDVKRFLSERPNARGLAAPGMPVGSPGMEMGTEKEPYDVVQFGDQGYKVFARH